MKGIMVSGNTKIKREIVPSGTHVARCYSMIHIGTIQWEYQGEQKFANKVRLTFELPNELRDFGGEEKPMVISKEYTLSLHEKSNLRKDLEIWRGNALTKNDLNNFDITDLIGKDCMISVLHKVSASGNDYAQIGNVNAIGKGVSCPKQINKSFIFNYEDNFNSDWLDQQPEWIRDQIKSSDEFENKMNQLKYKVVKKDTNEDMPF